MDGGGGYHPQQTKARTENQIPRVFTYKWELNDENTWIYRGEKQKLGSSRWWRLGGEGGSDQITNGY